MSYRKHHIKNKIQKNKPKRPFFTKLWFWIGFFVVLLVVSGVYFSLFYTGLQINSISVSGNLIAKTSDIEEIIQKSVDTSLFNFSTLKLTSKSILLVDQDKINQEILKKLSIIEKVTVNKNWPQSINVNIIERIAVGIYCQGSDLSNCYSIDKNGVIFSAQGGPASGLENYIALGSLPIVRQTINNDQIFIGKEVVQDKIMQAIEKINKDLKDNFKIGLQQVLIVDSSKLDMNTSENWHIYVSVDPDFDIGLQITKLNLLLNGGISSEERKNLKYIDLRMKDRAIICDNIRCAE